MYKTFLCALFVLVLSSTSSAQKKSTITDSTEYYNDLFNELDDFLDSITTPQNFLVANISFTNNYFNFTNNSNIDIEANRKLSLTPSIGYYHKTGFGLNAATVITHDGDKWNAF